MRFVIAGNDLRAVALSRALRGEGHVVTVVPRLPAEAGRPKWEAVRAASLMDEVIAAEPDAVVCLHIESSQSGIVDRLRDAMPLIPIFGVSAAAARIETSRLFGLEIARDAGLRIPLSEVVVNDDRVRWLAAASFRFPSVVKYCGLLGGRGSQFAHDRAGLERIMRDLPAGDVVVQELVTGDELALSMLLTSRDVRLLNVNFEYKRRLDGDRGENTYGMGTVARNATGLPLPDLLLRGTVDALRGIGYRGPVDINFIVDRESGEATFLEFTARFGDPELSSEILLLDDVGEMLLSVARDDEIVLHRRPAAWAMGVVATGGTTREHHGVVVDGVPDDDVYFSAAGESLDDVRASIARALGESGATPYRTDIGHDAERRWQTYECWFADQRAFFTASSFAPNRAGS